MLHYSAPPVVGGVEAVLRAHAGLFRAAGQAVTVVAGRGAGDALPAGARFAHIPELDSRHPAAERAQAGLADGEPGEFEALRARLAEPLGAALAGHDDVVVHNVLTKHFNLALTAALWDLLDAGRLGHVIAWCHDISWTSPSSRAQLRPGAPWDLLRTPHPRVTYVAVSRRRQAELAGLFGWPAERVPVVPNGVDPVTLLGFSKAGAALIARLDLLSAELLLLMPVRVTRAKNVEFALHTLAALRAGGEDVRLVLTGPPDPHDPQNMSYYEELRRLRSRLGLDGAMHFVYECGPRPDEGLTIGARAVGDLLAVSDVLFMPSRREGFGMPVLEAGLAGVPVVCTPIPAAQEVGGEDVVLFDLAAGPEEVGARIRAAVAASPTARLRRRVRREYTWQALFERAIRPLLRGAGGAGGAGGTEAGSPDAGDGGADGKRV
jgi:glycosyltransferase involved in cell wall biosynthesis